jgi:hypothetical protein
MLTIGDRLNFIFAITAPTDAPRGTKAVNVNIARGSEVQNVYMYMMVKSAENVQ